MKYPKLFLCLFILLASTANAGEVFRWVDENGKVHFSDRATKQLHEQKTQQRLAADQVDLKPVNRSDPSDTYSQFYSDQKDAEQKEKYQKQLAKQELLAKERELKRECERWVKEYNSFGNRNNTITYMVDDNGKTLSEKEQQAELRKMRSQLVQMGCMPP